MGACRSLHESVKESRTRMTETTVDGRTVRCFPTHQVSSDQRKSRILKCPCPPTVPEPRLVRHMCPRGQRWPGWILWSRPWRHWCELPNIWSHLGPNSLTFIFAQIYDYEYDHKDPKEESVLHDHAWGFCDPKCFVRKEDILALDLQEVPFRLKKYNPVKAPTIRWSCGFFQRRSAGTGHGLTAKPSLGQWWTGRTLTLFLNFVSYFILCLVGMLEY